MRIFPNDHGSEVFDVDHPFEAQLKGRRLSDPNADNATADRCFEKLRRV